MLTKCCAIFSLYAQKDFFRTRIWNAGSDDQCHSPPTFIRQVALRLKTDHKCYKNTTMVMDILDICIQPITMHYAAHNNQKINDLPCIIVIFALANSPSLLIPQRYVPNWSDIISNRINMLDVSLRVSSRSTYIHV